MRLRRKKSDDNLYWLIELLPENPYSVIKAFKKDVSEKANSTLENYTSSLGIQYFYEEDEAIDCEKWIRSKIEKAFEAYNIKKKITKCTKKWSIKYPKGGWQALHAHGRKDTHENIITSVLYFDGKENSVIDGALATVWPGDNNTMEWHETHTEPGKLIVMSGNLVHGAYPCSYERNIIVMDFWIEDE